jgi:hypothetical protein
VSQSGRRNLPGGDTEPWYRQFWPWFLILLPATVVVAALTTVVIANRGADDLVVDDYYRDGLAINRQLERQRRAEALGIGARLAIDGLRVEAVTRGPVDAPTLDLTLSHPLESDRDFQVTLRAIGAGHYLGELQQPVGPRWHWILTSPGEASWRLDGTLGGAELGHADP